MNWTLEVVVVPGSDIDRSKAFYADQLGFDVDFDSVFDEQTRLVQLTPPGSGCSLVIGRVAMLPAMPPGSLKGLHLVVNDIKAAHAELVERGVEVTDVRKVAENPHEGDPLDNVGFVFFDDPDGNSWGVQQI